jgi:predicted aspartyl protease
LTIGAIHVTVKSAAKSRKAFEADFLVNTGATGFVPLK